MRIAFMGTPDFAVPTLDALIAAGHDVAAVYSQPPRPAGRGKVPRPSPVHARAEALGIAVRTPLSLRDAEAQAAFAALDLDVAVVAAYGLILPEPVLQAPRYGCLNVHASLLPRWRGAAPIVRAILAGDTTTGVTIMQMEKGLDTGPMLATVETLVNGKTGGTLTDELAAKGAALMAEVLADLAAYPRIVQPEAGVTYAAKIDKAEARIDFAQDAAAVERQVRAFNPVPGAFFEHAGERVRVLACKMVDTPTEAAWKEEPAKAGSRPAPGYVYDDALTILCGDAAVIPIAIQRAGRGVMTAAELLRGWPIPAGTQLG